MQGLGTQSTGSIPRKNLDGRNTVFDVDLRKINHPTHMKRALQVVQILGEYLLMQGRRRRWQGHIVLATWNSGKTWKLERDKDSMLAFVIGLPQVWIGFSNNALTDSLHSAGTSTVTIIGGRKRLYYMSVQTIQKWRTLIFWAYVVIGESMKAPVASEMAHWNQWLRLRFLKSTRK